MPVLSKQVLNRVVSLSLGGWLLVLGVGVWGGVAGCQPEPKSPYDYTPSPTTSSTSTPYIGDLPSNPTDYDYFATAIQVYSRLFEILFEMDAAREYSNPPPELDQLVRGEYRNTIQQVIDNLAESGHHYQGEFSDLGFYYRPYGVEQHADAVYVLEVCRDATKLAIYDGADQYLGQGVLTHDVFLFQQEGEQIFIFKGSIEKVDECPF